jgi:hypothetical protein
MVARELRELRADIIGLQEASWSRQRGDVAAPLAAQLGFHHFYPQANSRFFGNRGIDRVTASLLNFTEGPAVVSRFPIVAWEVAKLEVLAARATESARVPPDWVGAHMVHASVPSQKSANKSKACGGTPSTTGPAGQPASGRRGGNGHSCLLALHSTARRAPLGRRRRSKAGRFSTKPGARRGAAAGRRIIKRTSNSGH